MSVFTIGIGVVVLLYGILVEDEPTFVALFLIASGFIGYLTTRHRISSRAE